MAQAAAPTPAQRTPGLALPAAWVTGALAASLTVVTLVLVGVTPSERVGTLLTRSPLLDAALVLSFVAYSAVGVLIVVRQPTNRVGWIFLVAGLAFQLWVFSWYYAAAGLVVWPGPLPAARLAAWVSLWAPVVGFGLAFTFLLMLFPDGRLPSRRWRGVARFAATALLVWGFTWATAPGPLDSFPEIDNPLGVAAVGRIDPGVGWVLFVLAVLASVASLIVRFRRSTGSVRRQIRWFALAAPLPALALVTVTAASEGWRPAELVGDVLFPAAVVAVPVAAFVAIFKHDLYDLDLVVSKTLTFVALAALITGVYVAVVAGIGVAAGAAGELSVGLAVLTTAVVAVAFEPARARIQHLANRLVYGSQATPYEVLAQLSRRMGSAMEATEALPEMARIIGQGTNAERTSVWLSVGSTLHEVAAWPQPSLSPRPPIQGRAPPGASRVAEVRQGDDLLGFIAVTLPPGRAMSPTEERLLGDVGAQARLVLSNVRLIEEVKASRQRLVTAQDEERRRLERDIHDGVQQRLVTLSLNLKMAAEKSSGPAAATAALDRAGQEAAEALVELRRLARGIHPAIVTEGGLAAAVESLVERSPIPVHVHSLPTDRLPAPVEISAYYLVAEALTNAAKHAAASAVSVRVASAAGRCLIEVDDDGVGGAAASPGSGLAGIADRVAALGGSLHIDSQPQRGTRLRAEIPCASS